MHALYICYFGLNEPLVQTQVLPYLRELVARGFGISLLTFERDMKSVDASALSPETGITWYALPYHKRPTIPATLYDIAHGAMFAARLARRESISIFHGRSHVGTAIGAAARALAGGRLIFDIRGLLADEYADSGNWQQGDLRYRLTKAAERRLIAAADGIVVLTERLRQTLFPNGADGRPLEVIPCCVDAVRFAKETEKRHDGRVVYVYAGALGGFYLINETADLLAAARARDPRTYALFLTMGDPSQITAALRARGFSEDDFRVLRAHPDEVPALLRSADVGLAIIKPSFARSAMSPTKYAEYLAAGLPVIVTPGIGDLDGEVRAQRVGVVLESLDSAGYRDALSRLEELRRDPDLTTRCIQTAGDRYDLHMVGGERYERLYRKVSAS